MITRLVAISLCLFLAASLVHPIGDSDLGWHLAAGRWAIAHGELPTVDYWNRTAVGHAWLPYSWSSEVLFAGVEGRWGWEGLLGLSAVFALILVFSFQWAFSAIAGDAVIGMLLSILAVAACQDHFDLRPQSLTWAFLAIALLCGDTANRVRGASPLILFCVVCCFWANTHITTIFALLAAGTWAFSPRAPRLVIPLLLSGFLGSLLTPNFGAEWLVTLKKVDHPFLYSIISEFQPATIWHQSAALVLLSFIVLAVLVREHPRTLPLHILLLTALFVILGFAIQKFIPYAAILTAAAIARLWRDRGACTREKTPLSYGITACESGMKFVFEKGGLFVILLCLGIAAGHLLQVAPHPIDRLSLPVAAVDYVKNNHLPSPILNDFGDGGYIMYRFLRADGSPEQLVSLDGRTNVNDPQVMGQFVNTIIGNSLWEDYLKTIQPNLVIWRNRYALPTILLTTGDWCRLYSDATPKSNMRGWSVLVRRGSHPLCAIREKEADA